MNKDKIINYPVALKRLSHWVSPWKKGSSKIYPLSVLMAFSSLFVSSTLQATTVIDEDFSSSAANFSVIAGGSWNVSSGRYVLSSPVDSGTNGVLGDISVHNTTLGNDYELSVLMRITGTGSAWNDAAIIFDYQDQNNYYYVSLNESNDGYTKGIFKVVSGSPTELADIGSTVTSDTDYTIEIDRSGSSIIVRLNSSQIASISDSTFSGGKVGFGSKNDGAQFDNLLVDAASGIDAFSQIEGEGFDAQSGLGIYSGGTGQKIGSIENGTWARYDDVNFGSGATGFSSSTASATSGGAIQLRLDSTTGTLVGSATVTGTGGWNNFTTVNSSVSGASGVHDLYLVFVGGSGALLDVDYFVFTSGSSQVAAPQFSPGGGSYSSTQNVTITSATSGSTIRYTTNGSTPTSSSGTVYSGAISVSSTTTLKAIAYKSGMTDSSVSSASYTIGGGGGGSFPTPSTTGTSGTLTSYSGTITTLSDGQLIEDLDISGSINVNHKNVTIRNCRFGSLNIQTSTPTTGQNCLVEDSELGWAGRQNFTLRRCYVETYANDLIRIGGGNVTIEDCYLLITGPRPGDEHTDIIQSYPVADYDNVVVNHNTMLNECNATSCINGPYMTITNNLMAGGSKTVYTSRSTITNNRFSTVYFSGVGYYGIYDGGNSNNTCSGNVIHETGATVSCQ